MRKSSKIRGCGKCQRRDLNPRPRAYESPALPLSYSGKVVGYKEIRNIAFHLLLTECYSLFYINGVQRQENVMKAAPLGGDAFGQIGELYRCAGFPQSKSEGSMDPGEPLLPQYRLPGERSARRVPLVKDGRPAANLTEAMEARDEILYARRHGVSMPTRGRKPMLSAAIAEYIGHHRHLGRARRSQATSGRGNGGATLSSA